MSIQGAPALPAGMVLTVATIAMLRRSPGYARVRLEASEFAELVPAGHAPVFKVLLPPVPGQLPLLPGFGAGYLPTWGEGDRPVVRSYTAIDFSPPSAAIEFIARDLGSDTWWIDRFAVGDRVGVIGFRHELRLSGETDGIIVVGDESARGAVVDLMMGVAQDLPMVVAVPERDVYVDDPLPARSDVSLLRSAVDQAGFPDVNWGGLVEQLPSGPPKRPAVWLGGERAAVADLRAQALAAGVPAADIVAQPYWAQGMTRDEFDRMISTRYRRAADQGLNISDAVVGAELELA